MEYRELGRTGKKVSLLSLGCMRLPEDDEEGAKVVSRAVDLGINYFETSEGYCGGRSEVKLGMGIKGRRDKVYISTKQNIRPDTTADEIKRKFEVSLKRLEVDHVDFYQLWDFRNPSYDAIMKKGGALDVYEKLRDEGLISHIGATTHDTNENIIDYLNTGRFESVTLTYNMMDRTCEPVIQHVAEKGIGVVIMKPLAGGLLATPSEIMAELVPGQHPSSAAAALRFVMSNPHVTTIPSGMQSITEIEENVRTWADLKPFSQTEISDLVCGLDEYTALGKEFCTGCGYCRPCPSGVKIAHLFRIRNYHKVFGLRDWANRSYRKLDATALPENCTECGECETKCPNDIPIISQLKEVAEMFQGVRV